MSENDLFGSVERAREHVLALRARLDQGAAPWGTSELRGALGELLGVFDNVQAHYDLLNEVLTLSGDAIFAKDRRGRYVMINARGAGMLGKAVEDVLGEDDTALFGPEGAARVMAVDRLVMKTGKPQTFEETFDLQGDPITLLTTASIWYQPGGGVRGVIGTARDVTAPRRAERREEVRQERLRALASEIVIAEEHLRQSLATDLHEGISQDLALIKMMLATLRSSPGEDLRAEISKIEVLVEQADRSLRSIAFRLGPPSLHDLGLVPALHRLARDIGERYELDVQVEDGGAALTSLDHRGRVLMFRAVRELLTNAVSHAAARGVRVSLESAEGFLRVTVADDGVGFDPAQGMQEGYGLLGISEQLKGVGGDMHIRSSSGLGTVVTLRSPLGTTREGAH